MGKKVKLLINIILISAIISAALFTAIAIPAESNTKYTNKISIPCKKESIWTIMIYLDGDNELSKYAVQKISEIREVNLKNDVNIVILLDERGENNTHCYIFGEKEENIQINKICNSWKNEVNMGDPLTLLNFVSYAMKNYPAQKYVLELWGHGYGQKGMCNDETSCDRLTLQEITFALTKAKDESNSAIDILVLTACYMGDAKCVQKLRNASKYIIASADEMPASGLPYTMIFNYLTEKPSISPKDFCSEIIEIYHNHYHLITKSLLSVWDTGYIK